MTFQNLVGSRHIQINLPKISIPCITEHSTVKTITERGCNSPMMVDVCENPNIVYYWLSQAEKEDMELQSSLTAQRKEWKDKGYRVCTFISGKGNLVDLTKDLLVHNRDILVQKQEQAICENVSATAEF